MKDIKTSIVYNQEQIQKRVKEMADTLTQQLKGKRVVTIEC